MKKKIVAINLLMIVFFLGCDSGSKINTPLTVVKTTLKNAIELGWDKNILNMYETFPGGKVIRGNLKKRIAARYILKVKLLDIDAIGNLTFHQREENLKKGTWHDYPIRIVTLKGLPQEKLKTKFEEIQEYIKATYPKIFTTI